MRSCIHPGGLFLTAPQPGRRILKKIAFLLLFPPWATRLVEAAEQALPRTRAVPSPRSTVTGALFRCGTCQVGFLDRRFDLFRVSPGLPQEPANPWLRTLPDDSVADSAPSLSTPFQPNRAPKREQNLEDSSYEKQKSAVAAKTAKLPPHIRMPSASPSA